MPENRGRRLFRTWLLFVVAAVLAAGGTAGYLWWQEDVPEPPVIELTADSPPMAAAINAARDGVCGSPRSAAAWGRLGIVLYAFDFFPEATECFARAERLDQHDPAWPFLQAAWRGPNDPEVIPKVARALELAPQVADVQIRLADALAAQGRHDEAERHFSEVLQREPGNPRVQLGLGRLAFARGQYRESLEFLRQAANSPATRKSAYMVLAEAHQALGDAGAAAEEVRRLTTLPEDQNTGLPFFGREVAKLQREKDPLALPKQMMARGRLPEAIVRFNHLVKTYPEWEEAWVQLGQAQILAGDRSEGERSLRAAVGVAPGSARAHYTLGGGLWYMGRHEEAADCLRRALELQPNYAEAHQTLALCLERQGDEAGAIDELLAAVRYCPSLVEAHLELARLLAAKGRSVEAQGHLAAAARLRPDDAAIAKRLNQLQKTAPADRR